MKRFFYVIAIILVILFGAYFQYVYCCGGTFSWTKSNVAAEKTVAKKVTNFKDFFIKDGDFSLNFKDNFNFMPSSFILMNPISDGLKGTIGKLKSYIDENPNKHLTIKGYYAEFEKNRSVFPNLGVARANAVKKYFIGQGVDHKHLHIVGELTGDIKEGQSPLRGIVSYEVVTLDDDTVSKQVEELKAFAKEFRKNPLTVYFETGSSYIDLTEEERDKIQKITDYLNQVDGSQLLIVGHTDNIGSAQKNKVLAQDRAEFVKKYFVKNGFDSDVIEVVSKGQYKPIASNRTKEGRAKNRRVEITLK